MSCKPEHYCLLHATFVESCSYCGPWDPNKHTLEEDFWNARTELKHVFDFARSRRAAPWATLAVVLVRIIASVGPQFMLPKIIGTKTSLNMFVAIVAKSGGGKDAAQGAARDAVILVGEPFSEVTPGSGEGIAHAYMRRTKLNGLSIVEQHTHNVLFSVAEVDTLVALKGRQGSTLMSELRMAWMGQRLGFQYADPEKRLPVPAQEYRFCLVAGVQPLRAKVLLLDESDGGLPQRFVWVSAVDKGAPDERPPEPEPWKWVHPSSTELIVPICQTAFDTIDRAALARERDEVDALDGHLLLCQEKVAVALGLFNGRIEIDDEDWRLAGIFMEHSNETRASIQRELTKQKAVNTESQGKAEGARTVAAKDVVESDAIAKTCTRILAVLVKTNEWVRGGSLRSAVNADYRKWFDVSIERLEATGQIETEDIEYQGTSGKRYRLRRP
jgi:hypothetical protein